MISGINEELVVRRILDIRNEKKISQQERVGAEGQKNLEEQKRHKKAKSETFLKTWFVASPINLCGGLSTTTEVNFDKC